MAIQEKLIDAADGEWKRWGFSLAPLHRPKQVGGTEQQVPYVQFVNDYWTVAGKPEWNGKSPFPWSAAFISFCFASAGAGAGFPYRTGHWDYCAQIVNEPDTYPKLKLEPASTPLATGDVIWAARGGRDCPAPPTSSAEALAGLQAGRWFCSHADIVIALRAGEVDVIGGNVSDSVTKSTYTTTRGMISDPRHLWLGVIKSTL